jgi:hypothetical protein
MGIFTFISRTECMPTKAGAESRRRKNLKCSGRTDNKAGAEATEESI